MRLPPYVTIAIFDRTEAMASPPACPRRSAEMGGIIDRLCEREPVTSASRRLLSRPPCQFLWQHRSILVRQSTSMPPLRSEIYAWIDGRLWKRCPPRKQPTLPGRVYNPPCLWYGTNWRLPVSKISATGRLTNHRTLGAIVPARPLSDRWPNGQAPGTAENRDRAWHRCGHGVD